MSVKKTEVVNACRKLGFEEKTTRRGKHLKFTYNHNGRDILRVTIPHGRDELPTGTENAIRNSFSLSKEDFGKAIRCPLKKDGFTEIIEDLIDKKQL